MYPKQSNYELRRERHALLGRARNRTEDDAADEIHCEGTDWEQSTGCAQERHRKKVARDRSERAANRNEQDIHVE